MSRDPDHSVNGLENDNTGGLMTGFLAEEEEFDRRALWRVGSWGAASVGAVIVALLANQFSTGLRREQIAAVDLVRQSQQIQSIAKESQLEARRLASAIDTLNGDRDRLYSRVAVLEQGLDSMTGAIARQTDTARQTAAVSASTVVTPAAPAETVPAAQTPPPAVSPVATVAAPPVEKPRAEAAAPPPAPATVASIAQAAPQGPAQSTSQASSQDKPNAPAPTPATPFVTAKSMLAPPDSTATKLIEPEPAKPAPAAPKAEATASVVPADDAEPDEAEAAPPQGRRAAHRIRGRCRRRQFGRRPARAVARAPEVKVECGTGQPAADHRDPGRLDRAWHAAAAGGRAADRCGGGSQNLRRPDRKRAAVRDHRVRRSAPCHE
jgi:hypothetical protein